MRKAVYNSAIPEAIPKSVNRVFRSPRKTQLAQLLLFAIFGSVALVRAADWSGPEQQLARKIVAVTGPGAVALTVENRSSLSKRDAEIIQNGLRADLEQLGLRFVAAEQAAAAVSITLSENATSYVWVAQIRQGGAEAAVAMVSLPRAGGTAASHDSMPMALRKTLLWSQDDLILDVAVLEENATPARIAVLDRDDKVSLYRWQGGKWMAEQTLEIAHAKPWPRDLRGRVIPAKDHLLDVYLPGVTCRSNSAVPLTLNCRETDDPWPLVAAGLVGNAPVFPTAGTENKASVAIPATAAFFAPTRNFFTGAFTPAMGKFTNVTKFYSAALVPREKYILWFFAATDGRIHMIDGMNQQSAMFGWGSSIGSVKTSCGAGWQVLATNSGEAGGDSVRAYEFPDRDPVAVSAAVEFPGSVRELWTEARGDSAVVVVKDQDTGSYEAFRLAMACSQ